MQMFPALQLAQGIHQLKSCQVGLLCERSDNHLALLFKLEVT